MYACMYACVHVMHACVHYVCILVRSLYLCTSEHMHACWDVASPPLPTSQASVMWGSCMRTFLYARGSWSLVVLEICLLCRPWYLQDVELFCIHLCVCTYMHDRIFMRMCIWIYIYIYIYMSVCSCTYTWTFCHACNHAYIYVGHPSALPASNVVLQHTHQHDHIVCLTRAQSMRTLRHTLTRLWQRAQSTYIHTHTYAYATHMNAGRHLRRSHGREGCFQRSAPRGVRQLWIPRLNLYVCIYVCVYVCMYTYVWVTRGKVVNNAAPREM